MARSRNIKPGFFTNDVLGELPPLARLLFVGLWTVCDRDGRCEDRPKKIRAEVLPYDDCDVEVLLGQLANAGFIDRYEADGRRVVHVVNWHKHQNPHVKEAPSTLPARCELGASTVLAPGKKQPEPEEAGLIPSTLIPESLSSDSLQNVASVKRAAAPATEGPKALAATVTQPAEVSEQVWHDWLMLRKKKGAPVTETVFKAAAEEAKKAGLTLEAFLQTWCLRGSQGLQADWLRTSKLHAPPPRVETATRNAQTAAILGFSDLEIVDAAH
jgi:hypothetical protein